MTLLIIFNPHAAHGRAARMLDKMKSYLGEKKLPFEIQLTERQGHAIEIVEKADFGDYTGIAAAGGDGTLFEVVTAYFRNQSKQRIPLGVIPTGTGNAFARDMNLKALSWMDAVDVIAAGGKKQVDVGRIRTQGSEYHFMNIIGLGFVADVGDTARKLKWIGNLSYTLGVFHRTIGLKTFRMTLEADGKIMERENLFTEISNTRYTSNFLMAPRAKIDDGLFDVTLCGKLSRRRLLSAFPKIFTGEHIHLPEIEHFQAKRIRIDTEIPKILTPDGELLGSTPLEIECLPRAVEVFWK